MSFVWRDGAPRELGGKVPIGLIASDWGGQEIQVFSSPGAFASRAVINCFCHSAAVSLMNLLLDRCAERHDVWGNTQFFGFSVCKRKRFWCNHKAISDWKRSQP
eukprot:COSAG02_NODE_1158_length_14185_cov_21.954778_3_plen_104_part_00